MSRSPPAVGSTSVTTSASASRWTVAVTRASASSEGAVSTLMVVWLAACSHAWRRRAASKRRAFSTATAAVAPRAWASSTSSALNSPARGSVR